MYNICIILDSSAVEHSAVNRTVTGSNPVQGVLYGLLVEWLRCLPFTEETRGSIPLQAIINNFRSFNGRTEVFGAFNWSSNLYRKICLGSSMVEHHTCNMVVGGSIPLQSLIYFLWCNKTMNETILISILFALVAIMFILIFVVIFQIKKIFKSYDNNFESLKNKTAKLVE